MVCGWCGERAEWVGDDGCAACAVEGLYDPEPVADAAEVADLGGGALVGVLAEARADRIEWGVSW